MFDLLGTLFHNDPELAAAWGTWVAVVGALLAVTETYRTRLRSAVTDALRDFTGADLAAARDRLGAAAAQNGSRISKRRAAQIRHDIFLLMWAVERLSLVRNAAKTALATDQTTALYAHTEIVVTTVNTVRARFDLGASFEVSAARANRVLDSLPDASGPWRKRKNSAPNSRFLSENLRRVCLCNPRRRRPDHEDLTTVGSSVKPCDLSGR